MPADVEYIQPLHLQQQDASVISAQAQNEAEQPSVGTTQRASKNANVGLVSDTAFSKSSKQLDQALGSKEQDGLNRLQAKFTEYNKLVQHPSSNSLS